MANPSLAELDGGKTPEQLANEKKDADLLIEQQKQTAAKAEQDAAEKKKADDAAAAAQAAKTPEQLAEEQKEADLQRLAELKLKPADQLTAEEKTEIEKLSAVATVEEPDTSFWEDVEKLSGVKLNVEFKDENGADVDPMSPEGVLIREKAVRADAVTKFEQHLKQNDPRGYAYILHRQAGGTDEDFFAKKTVSLPEYETFKESVDLQTKVYTDSLIRKGVNEKQVKLLVDLAVKDKEIFELADKAYKEYQSAQEKDLEKAAKLLEENEKQYEARVKELNTMISTEISSSRSMKFVVPESKKAGFTQFVRDHLAEDNGKFLVVQEINDKKLPRILESLYLQFINGDLSGLVQRSAQTVNAKRLGEQLKKTTLPKNTDDPAPGGKKYLGDL